MYPKEGCGVALPPDSFLWWPTNSMARLVTDYTQTRRSIEHTHFAIYLAFTFYSAAMLNQASWINRFVVVGWSLGSTVSLAAVMLHAALAHNKIGIEVWIVVATVVQRLVTIVGNGCQCIDASGGRHLIPMLIVIGLYSASTDLPAVGLATMGTVFVGALIYDSVSQAESKGYCIAQDIGGVPGWGQIWLQLVIPLIPVLFAVYRIAEHREMRDRQSDRSDAFARECLKAAICKDTSALLACSATYDASNPEAPTTSDDALQRVISILGNNAREIPPRFKGGSSPPRSTSAALQ